MPRAGIRFSPSWFCRSTLLSTLSFTSQTSTYVLLGRPFRSWWVLWGECGYPVPPCKLQHQHHQLEKKWKWRKLNNYIVNYRFKTWEEIEHIDKIRGNRESFSCNVLQFSLVRKADCMSGVDLCRQILPCLEWVQNLEFAFRDFSTVVILQWSQLNYKAEVCLTQYVIIIWHPKLLRSTWWTASLL